jgi:KamA family protein
VTPQLLSNLTASRLKTVLVVHCNHPRELAPDVRSALNTLATNGVTLLNQSVLLREVNDNSRILVQLSRALFQQNVLPYYLHLPDKVAGTSHFAVTEQDALEILKQMRSQLPGYLVPELVKEEPGESAKTRLI